MTGTSESESESGGGAADNRASETSTASIASIATMAGDFHRTLLHSTHSALHSARSFQDSIPQIKSQYRTYEDAFFKKVKDEMMSARENPAAAFGVAFTAGLLLMRGPRRFLFRHTLGLLQSEEAQFVRAEKNVKELNLSVDLMKKESRKLLERTALAEKDMQRGRTELMNIGSQIQRFAKSVHKVEAQAADLMDGLREIPSREALKLRAEVASMASFLKRQRVALDRRIMKISELGVPV